jgi:Tol biopolymer transport system component
MLFRKFTFGILLFCFVHTAYGQKKWEILYKENIAEEFFNKNDFNSSLHLYQELDSLNKDGNYDFQIAMCFINLNNNSKALPYFEKCLTEADKYPPALRYFAGKTYHLSHRFDDAIIQYNFYREQLLRQNSKKKNAGPLADVDREIEICRFGKELVAHPLSIKISNLGPVINSEYPEYGALLSADEHQLVFTSNRPGTTGGQIDQGDGMGLYYEDIYISRKTDSGWSKPENAGLPVNSEGNDASVSLTADGQKLILYRSGKGNLISANSGDLYISTVRGSNWNAPERLPDAINSRSWEPSASISADERVLYFASNRDGGFGGTDIYLIRKLPNGEWAMPMNLGPEINTPEDEDSPFIHPDGQTLYFSSKGHRTMGGFDVFVSKFNMETRKWSGPENVGYPINTAHDDIHFTWSADGKRVYFSTIRPEGYGDKDIYFAEMETKETELVVIKGLVLDSTSKKPLEATIRVTDKLTKELIGIFNSNSETGKYLVVLPEGKNYDMIVSAANHDDCNQEFILPSTGGFEVMEKNINLCPKKK